MKAPNEITLPVLIKNFKFASNINIIANILKGHEGNTIDVTFKKRRNKRSNKQNKYYWSIIVVIFQNCILEEWGEVKTKQEVHEFLKYNCNYEEKVNEDTGEVLRVVISTTENTTSEQEVYHTRCRNLCKEFFNTDIPLPNEEVTLNFDRK